MGQYLLDIGSRIEADRRGAQQLGPAEGQQIGGTWSGADEMNGHGVSLVRE